MSTSFYAADDAPAYYPVLPSPARVAQRSVHHLPSPAYGDVVATGWSEEHWVTHQSKLHPLQFPVTTKGPGAKVTASRSTVIAFSGSVCLGIIAAALTLTGNTTMSGNLAAATVCGAVGSLFTMAALSCGVSTGRLHSIMSPLCAAVGTVCVIAATQTWLATTFTGVCAAGVIGMIWRSGSGSS